MARMKDRGQMLLIGAIVMAASFVVLAIVLNGSFYTQTLSATASEDVRDGQLGYVQENVESDVEFLVQRVISNSPASPVTRIESHVNDLSTRYGIYYARHDLTISVTPTTTTGVMLGQRIVQSSSGPFESPAGAGDWTVLSAGRMRGLTFTDVSFPGSGGPFIMRITETNSGEEWNLRIENQPAGPMVRLRGGPNNIDEACVAGYQRIDVANGTLGSRGRYCTALSHLDEVEAPYSVRFINGDDISGQYEFVGTGLTVSGTSRLYGVEVQLSLGGVDGAITTEMIVAPEEIHE